MDLAQYVDNLRQELAVAAEAAGEEGRKLAERLTAPLESAIRLTLLNALSAAADEITRDLAPGSVDVRLRGLDPDFVVKMPPQEKSFDDAEAEPEPHPAPPVSDEAATSRINFRLPDQLKLRIEEAASSEGLSVNAWLTRSVSATLDSRQTPRRTGRTDSWGTQRYTGWVR